MERQTPAKGSPVRKVVRRMSPGRGQSGLRRSKRRRREEVGSRVCRWAVVTAVRGKGWRRVAEGGGG